MSRDIKALQAWQASREAMPMQWGVQDCVTYAAGAVKALTGVDVLDGRGSWVSEAEALAMVQAGGGIEAIMGSVLKPVPPALAHRGDIAAVAIPGAFAFALVVVEGQTLAGPGANRVRRLPRKVAVLAWSADQKAEA